MSEIVSEVSAPDEVDGALRTAVRAAAEVAELVRDSSIRRIQLTVADVRIEVERADTVPATVAVHAVQAAPAGAVNGAAAVAEQAAAGQVTVVAPLMGVFYRCPGPDQPPFTEVGQRVEAGDQVAIVEAMKMMNPVVVDNAGVVRAIHVGDGEVVEYEQPLFSIEPS